MGHRDRKSISPKAKKFAFENMIPDTKTKLKFYFFFSNSVNLDFWDVAYERIKKK